MINCLFCINCSDELKDRVRNSVHGVNIDFKSKNDISDLNGYEVVVGNVDKDLLVNSDIKWLQLESAGCEKYMSLLDKIIFSDYDVAHRALVIGTTNKTYLKLYNNWMSFNFPTNTSAVFYKDAILLDNKKLVLGGQGTLDIQTGWIYNNTANQPLITVENIFITLLSAGNIDVYIDFL